MPRRAWERDELLLALRLYFQTPFGRLHRGNPDIRELASALGRSPSAVAMKTTNLASLDPVHIARGVRGLRGASQADRDVWKEAHTDWEGFALDADAAHARIIGKPPANSRTRTPEGPTDVERLVQERRVQSFFRGVVLAAYDGRCAVTGLAVPSLLNAGHIIPWHTDANRRADPTNGIALNILHDRAFDRGLITFDDSLRLVVSHGLNNDKISRWGEAALLGTEGWALRSPERFPPDPEALRYHREVIFIS